ncbi:MAG: type II toxin-antitoxin system PemK/MazF family toxin [Planctomycetota bacterium]
MKAGQIFWADLDTEDRRPVLVVSKESLNRGGFVVVLPFTSARFAERSRYATSVPFSTNECGLPKDCVAQAEGITVAAVSSLDLATGPIGEVPEEKMREIVRAVGVMMDAQCEPE